MKRWIDLNEKTSFQFSSENFAKNCRHCCCHIHLPYAVNKLLINKYQDRKVALHQKPVINLIKHFKIVIYDSRVVLTRKLPIYDSRVVIYARKMFKRLATDQFASVACGQSYKRSTIVNYESRVTSDWKIAYVTTLEL